MQEKSEAKPAGKVEGESPARSKDSRVGSNGSQTPLRILFVGVQAHGSDSGGMAKAFLRAGHLVRVLDETAFYPEAGNSRWLRVLRRLGGRSSTKEFANKIVCEARLFIPHLVVVYKGAMMTPWVLEELRSIGAYLVNVYPDVSFMCHGPLIPQCMPVYDKIFTTKSFGVRDLRDILGVTNAEFLPHGFDPNVHRPVATDECVLEAMGADASFIGTWSPKKEKLMTGLAERLPDARIRIWGSQWQGARDGVLGPCIEGRHILGELYPMGISSTKVNICILSEKRQGSSSGDRTTSRTFQVPATGGFLLHERTDEFLTFFEEGREAACFDTAAELADKTRYYLEHEDERERIRLAGHQRCWDEDSLDHRIERIIEDYRDACG